MWFEAFYPPDELRLCRISILLIYTESNAIVQHGIYQAEFFYGGVEDLEVLVEKDVDMTFVRG